ncbi:MAG: hydrogenase nickel incorporation protein HypB [Myxococcales bacterium]|nr:hydrogenase nickel incorporation protein HypB [Myxococcales bacterium]
MHAHSHEDGHPHSHAHSHDDGQHHSHGNSHEDGHPHSHAHSHDDGQPHSHEHSHGDGLPHSHEHSHDHEQAHSHSHEHSHDGEHAHSHEHDDGHAHSHEHSHGAHSHDGHAHSHDAGHPHATDTVLTTHQLGASPALHETEVRRIAVEQDIMAKNGRAADLNRERFARERTFVVNLMSSPGSGKTTLLVRTLQELKTRGDRLAVIEGDQQTTLDADRIRATGVPAVQVNTGKGCHLDAEMIMRALAKQPAPAGGTLFIENVGNLVCPAGFDLGEAKKVVIASVTEGEDKPLKYPHMFSVADVLLLSKIDLLPHLRVDLPLMMENARQINPRLKIFPVSAYTGAGMSAWYDWLRTELADVVGASPRGAVAAEAQVG